MNFDDETREHVKMQWLNGLGATEEGSMTTLTGFAIPAGVVDDLDRAMENAIAAANEAAERTGREPKTWRRATIGFESGNKEEMWVRPGIEAFPLMTKGNIDLFGAREEFYSQFDKFKMGLRYGAAYGWNAVREQPGNKIKWEDTYPMIRSFVEVPMVLRDLLAQNWREPIIFTTKSTLTDNLIKGVFDPQTALRKTLKDRQKVSAHALELVNTIIEQYITDETEAAAYRKSFPFYAMSVLVGYSGVESKGKNQTKKVHTFKGHFPEQTTDEWVIARFANKDERLDLDAAVDPMIAWSNTRSEERMKVNPEERLEVLRRIRAYVDKPAA